MNWDGHPHAQMNTCKGRQEVVTRQANQVLGQDVICPY